MLPSTAQARTTHPTSRRFVTRHSTIVAIICLLLGWAGPASAASLNVPEGDQTGFTTSGSLEQAIPDLAPGQSCTFSMWVGKRSDGVGTSGRWNVQLTTGSWYIQYLLNGSLTSQSDQWEQYETSFTVNSLPNPPYRLRISGQWGFESFDQVELTCDGVNGGANLVADGGFETLDAADGTWIAGNAGPSWTTVGYGAGVFDPNTTQMEDFFISCDFPGSTCRVFLTEGTFTGDLGGLAGADAICQAEADAAGIGGTYVAWLSDSTTDAADRVTQASVPFVRPDGAALWDDWADMTTAGNDSIPENEIRVEADGDENLTPDRAWTGTVGPGATTGQKAGPYCGNWSSDSSLDNGLTGVPDASFPGPAWSADNASPTCDSLRRLYCFET